MCRLANLGVLLLASSLAMAQDTRVVLLGTGNPNPEPGRMGPAVAIISGTHVYIVDCGAGVVRRAAQAGIAMEQITRAFLTHLHSDHTVGLPDLIFTPAVTGRKEPLEIYGPPGTRAMTAHVRKAWSQDRQIRLHGLEPSVAQAYVVHAHDSAPGEIYRDSTLHVIAIPVNHGSWKHAYGYRFEAPDKTIVLSGDTTYSPGLIAAAQGCDILVHEVYSEKGLQARTADWQRYHRAFHTSARDVGRVASQVHPKTLVLYHQLPMGQTAEEVLQEIRETYSGTTLYGKDLDVIR
ncbi:RNAse Z [Candidatus Sulfopaludibacter sp. SbA3]|nr:RNAse Z [Candidatus Sulfopaludibacter sp. SbA3]